MQRWHPRLIEAAVALNENRLDVAERLLKPHLKDDPFDVRAIRMLAELAARIGRMRDAEALLRRAVELAPDSLRLGPIWRWSWGAWAGPPKRWNCSRPCSRLEPDDVSHWNLKAATLGRLGDFDEAIDLYEAVLEKIAEPARGVVELWPHAEDRRAAGRRHRRLSKGDRVEARRWARRGGASPTSRPSRFDEADIAAMRAALEAPGLRDEDRLHLDFALGKAMHDAAKSDEAFAPLCSGQCAAPASSIPSTRGQSSSWSIEASRPSRAKCWPSAGGCDAPDPIFIVGMPRAGSTLVEQILSSHVWWKAPPSCPTCRPSPQERQLSCIRARNDAEERRDAGEEYLKRASVQRRTDRPFFIDKLPNNWMFVPFIHLVLPNAKIIDARRHPLSCCFSNFRQHFARGQDFTYDLEDLGHYYSDYVRLMAHVDAVLPGRVHRVIYERMVDDTEAEIRALLDYCGLPFEHACLDSTRPSARCGPPAPNRYASRSIATRPRNGSGTSSILEPLKEALGRSSTPIRTCPRSPSRATSRRISNGGATVRR